MLFMSTYWVPGRVRHPGDVPQSLLTGAAGRSGSQGQLDGYPWILVGGPYLLSSGFIIG